MEFTHGDYIKIGIYYYNKKARDLTARRWRGQRADYMDGRKGIRSWFRQSIGCAPPTRK